MALALHEMLEALFGIKSYAQENSLLFDPATGLDQVGVAVARILTTNPQRVSFQVTNLSADTIYVALTNQVLATHGIRLAPNGGLMSVIWDRDFEEVSHEWWAISTMSISSREGFFSSLLVMGMCLPSEMCNTCGIVYALRVTFWYLQHSLSVCSYLFFGGMATA